MALSRLNKHMAVYGNGLFSGSFHPCLESTLDEISSELC